MNPQSDINRSYISGVASGVSVTYAPSGAPILKFRLESKEQWISKRPGEGLQERSLGIDVEMFGRGADKLGIADNDVVLVEGKVALDSWSAQDGTKRWKHSLKAFDVRLLSENRSTHGEEESEGNELPF